MGHGLPRPGDDARGAGDVMRDASTQMVYELAKQDARVMALTADNRNDIYERIHQEMPKQYIDYGIAEENMVASAAGLASCGKIPFLYTITDFMSLHALEFIRNDVCTANQNVKFLGRSSGLTSYTMGPTHQGTEELAILRTLPNLQVITPATPIEAREATRYAYEHDGPVYIRLEGRGEVEHFCSDYLYVPGRGHVLHDGTDVTIVAMGSIINEAIEAATKLLAEKISVRVIDMPMVKPLDETLILQAVKDTKGIVTLEEHSYAGGLGSAVAEFLAEAGLNTKFKRIGLVGCAKGCGQRQWLRDYNGIGIADLINTLKNMCE